MDLVEVARIAVRRWYVLVLVVVLGVGATFAVASSIAPQYRVDAQSILISGQSAPTPGGVEGPVNPYQAFSGSLFTTLSAVTRTVDGREFRERLDADGEARDFEFSTSQEAPVIITESLADTPEEATELSGQVQLALAETLSTLQGDENVPEDQQIVLRVLTTSAPQEETGSRVRVLFGGIGLTLAAAVAAAVLVESIIQTRRGTRRSTEASTEDERAPAGDAEDPVDSRDDAGSRDSADDRVGLPPLRDRRSDSDSDAAPSDDDEADDEADEADDEADEADDEADDEVDEETDDDTDASDRGARAVDV